MRLLRRVRAVLKSIAADFLRQPPSAIADRRGDVGGAVPEKTAGGSIGSLVSEKGLEGPISHRLVPPIDIRTGSSRLASRVRRRGTSALRSLVRKLAGLKARVRSRGPLRLAKTRRAILRKSRQIRDSGFIKDVRAAAFIRITRLVSSTLPHTHRPVPPTKVRQILVFGDMGLGNFLMFTPALRALRLGFPDAEIVVIFFKARGAELIAEGSQDIDRMLMVELPKRSGIRPFIKLVRACRAAHIQPDMILARWNGSPYVALLTMWLRARTRVGHISSAGFVGFCDDVFNFPLTMVEEVHEVERNLDLVRAVGLTPQSLQMVMPIPESAWAEADALIAERGLDTRRLVCLQTGSSRLQSWKRWPIPHWSALATKLVAEGYDLAYVGSEGERHISDEISAATPQAADTRRTNLSGCLSVNGTAALLARSRGIICNDSGLMHVAAAVGTPIIGLFGPTEYDRTRPFVDNCIVLRQPCYCNHGTLFSKKTLKAIEACARPCLRDTLPDEVNRHVLRLMPIERVGANMSANRAGLGH